MTSVMPACISLSPVASPDGGQSLAFVASACSAESYVISSHAEFSQAQQDLSALVARVAVLEDAAVSPPLPSSADSATAWGLGFSFVVGSYVIGWSAGAVVNFINRS